MPWVDAFWARFGHQVVATSIRHAPSFSHCHRGRPLCQRTHDDGSLVVVVFFVAVGVEEEEKSPQTATTIPLSFPIRHGATSVLAEGTTVGTWPKLFAVQTVPVRSGNLQQPAKLRSADGGLLDATMG